MIARYAVFAIQATGVFAAPSTVLAKTMTARQDIRQAVAFERPSRPGHCHGITIRRNFLRESQTRFG
jgi:hypothetical protein